jgi:hypothetical protein
MYIEFILEINRKNKDYHKICFIENFFNTIYFEDVKNNKTKIITMKLSHKQINLFDKNLDKLGE